MQILVRMSLRSRCKSQANSEMRGRLNRAYSTLQPDISKSELAEPHVVAEYEIGRKAGVRLLIQIGNNCSLFEKLIRRGLAGGLLVIQIVIDRSMETCL